jgi:hypothetical protein
MVWACYDGDAEAGLRSVSNFSVILELISDGIFIRGAILHNSMQLLVVEAFPLQV